MRRPSPGRYPADAGRRRCDDRAVPWSVRGQAVPRPDRVGRRVGGAADTDQRPAVRCPPVARRGQAVPDPPARRAGPLPPLLGGDWSGSSPPAACDQDCRAMRRGGRGSASPLHGEATHPARAWVGHGRVQPPSCRGQAPPDPAGPEGPADHRPVADRPVCHTKSARTCVPIRVPAPCGAAREAAPRPYIGWSAHPRSGIGGPRLGRAARIL